MRVLPLLILVVALVAAGCVKKDNGTPTPSTTPTGSTGGTTPTGSTAPTGTTPTDNTTTPTTGVQPKDLKSGSVTFTPDACPPQMPCAGFPVKFSIDPGYTQLTLNVTFTCAQGLPACVTNDASIGVGSNVCTVVAGPVQPPVTCKKPFAAADGQIAATGTGALTATYKLTES